MKGIGKGSVMNDMKTLFAVGYDKGEIDFAVSGLVTELTLEEMNKMREMIVVAIGIAEGMFRRSQEHKHPAASKAGEK